MDWTSHNTPWKYGAVDYALNQTSEQRGEEKIHKDF